MQKFNFLLPSFAILCTFYFSSCEGEVEFIDLNKNGKLDIYETPQLSASKRTEDLISYLTIRNLFPSLITSRLTKLFKT